MNMVFLRQDPVTGEVMVPHRKTEREDAARAKRVGCRWKGVFKYLAVKCSKPLREGGGLPPLYMYAHIKLGKMACEHRYIETDHDTSGR